MKRRIRKVPAEVAQRTFRTWRKRRMIAPGPPPEPTRPPLSQRMPSRIPAGSTTLAEGGRSLLTTTPAGITIAWDICGACSVHVVSCRCGTPRAPRSVMYAWFQDDARTKGEEWNPQHTNYKREFVKPEPTTEAETPVRAPTSKRKR